MELSSRMPIFCVLVFLCCSKLASAQSNPSDHPQAGNVDLELSGNGDWGMPVKRCKDLWTLCGIWAYDWSYNPPVCCRSQGPNKGIQCRTPSKHLQEWAAGFENEHKTYCLPIINESHVHWMGGGSRSGDSDSGYGGESYGPQHPRGGTGALANEEVVEQLRRIADALERAKP